MELFSWVINNLKLGSRFPAQDIV